MKAPTVIAEVRGWQFQSESGKAHYMTRPPGFPLILEREPTNQADPNAVMVKVACCDTMIGYIGKEDAAILANWMDKGVIYTAAVKNPASVINGYGKAMVQHEMTARCVPIEPKSVGQTTKKVKELDNAPS